MVRSDQPYTRMHRDHHYNRWEQNTLQPVRLIGQMLSCRHRSSTCVVWIDELEQDIAYSRSCVQCPFRPQARHSVFAISSFNRRWRSSSDKCDGRTGYLPLLWPLPRSRSLSQVSVKESNRIQFNRIMMKRKKNIDYRVIWLYYKKCVSEALCHSFANSIVYEQK